MRTDRIIFLDIDGVLNSHEFIDSKPDYRTEDLDPKSISCLNTILERTDAVIVISSTWRLAYPGKKLVQILEKQGVLPNRIIGKTPHLPNGSIKGHRGREVRMWFDCQIRQPESVLILDDDDDFDDHTRPFLLLTSTRNGLDTNAVEKAVRMLSSPNF
jgi:hypothetical protein